MAHKERKVWFPDMDEIEEELDRLSHGGTHHSSALRVIVRTILILLAVVILLIIFFVPISHTRDTSMAPTLDMGEFVAGLGTRDFTRGQIVMFHIDSRLEIKRIIGLPGDVVDIDEEGRVSVNGEPLDEPYVETIARGFCDIELPCEVPEDRVFVMGDNREYAVDSRARAFNCIPMEMLEARVVLRLFPIQRFELLEELTWPKSVDEWKALFYLK